MATPIENQLEGAEYYIKNKLSLIGKEFIQQLIKLNQWKSLYAILSQWLLIFIAIWLCNNYWHPLFYLLVLMCIGGRQHAIAILIHEGAHSRLFKNKFLNDMVSELLLAWPLFFTMKTYRKSHLAHHRYLNTQLDPDLNRKILNADEKVANEWKFPKTGKSLALLLLKDALAINTYDLIVKLRYFSSNKHATRDAEKSFSPLYRLIYYIIAIALFSYFHAWHIFLLYWLIPLLTWFKFTMRVRSIAEHFAIGNTDIYTMSRTTYPSLFERLFIAPLNIGYHLDHHFFPSVPFYNLPLLHKQLLKTDTYAQHAHITHSYFNVLKECIGIRKQ